MDFKRKYKTDHTYILKWAKKLICANRIGGQCLSCRIKDIRVLQFNHKDPEQKEFDICSNKNMHLPRLFEEVDKCELLCANCHAEKHQEDRGDNVVLRRRNTKKALLDYKQIYRCSECYYQGTNYASLDFHHRDELQKEMKPIQDACIYGLTARVCSELDKCDVICKNCHTKRHIKNEKFEMFYDTILKKSQSHKSNSKPDWKTIDRMYNIEHLSKAQIARTMNTTATAVSYALTQMSKVTRNDALPI